MLPMLVLPYIRALTLLLLPLLLLLLPGVWAA
jgi:hypothetical protein